MSVEIGFTNHGFKRFLERVNSKTKEKEACVKIKKIYRNGERINEMTQFEKRFCYSKMRKYAYNVGRIVKYDDIFYFFSKTGKCITCYPMGD